MGLNLRRSVSGRKTADRGSNQRGTAACVEMLRQRSCQKANPGPLLEKKVRLPIVRCVGQTKFTNFRFASESPSM